MGFSPAQPDETPEPKLHAQPRGEQRELVIVKGGQQYVFRCPPGEEAGLLRQLADLVRDPQNDITWFDVAVISHQLGHRLKTQLQRMHSAR